MTHLQLLTVRLDGAWGRPMCRICSKIVKRSRWYEGLPNENGVAPGGGGVLPVGEPALVGRAPYAPNRRALSRSSIQRFDSARAHYDRGCAGT